MRSRTSFVLFVFILSLVGVGTSASAKVLPAGTILHVRTTEPIFQDARPGTRIRGVVDRPIRWRGNVVVPSGAPAMLEVVDRSSNGRVDLSVRSIRVGGTRYTLSTNDVRLGGSTGPRRWQRGLIGAGVGAAVGGMVGGGTGAAVGSAAGAGVGAASGTSGRTRLYVPENMRLQFRVNTTTHIGR
jgi:hypothetical protein